MCDYRRPLEILSKNTKTGYSIDLPLQGHCRPTKNCSKDCYARFGHQAQPKAKLKHVWLSQYLAGNDQTELIRECAAHTSVRLCGSGDLLPEHLPAILRVATACPQTQFWGMTRKPEIAEALNGKLPNLHLLLSVDGSSPASVWKYKGAMCYGPRHAEDVIPEDDRIKVVFPRHFGGKVIKGIPRHPKDCAGTWHENDGCVTCGRCWTW